MLHPLSTDSGVWPKSALVSMQHGGPFERTVSAMVRKEAQDADGHLNPDAADASDADLMGPSGRLRYAGGNSARFR